MKGGAAVMPGEGPARPARPAGSGIATVALGLLAVLAAVDSSTAQGPAAPPQRLVQASTANIAYLFGVGWEAADRGVRDVVTFEYGHRWRYGDSFLFFDLVNLATRGDGEAARTGVYGEIQPRLSLGRLLGRCLCFGPVADLLTAHELNFSGSGGLAHLHGLGLAWSLPHDATLKTNVYVRDDLDLPGATWQLLVAGQASPRLAGERFVVVGFADLIGAEADRARNAFAALQLLWDAGWRLGQPGQLYLGFELHASINHLGAAGLDEYVPQLMAKWMF